MNIFYTAIVAALLLFVSFGVSAKEHKVNWASWQESSLSECELNGTNCPDFSEIEFDSDEDDDPSDDNEDTR